MEVYENHLGGIYFSEYVIPPDDLYCEQCGDSDWHLGHADTWEEVVGLIADDDGWIPYADDYVADIKAEFEAWQTERSE